MSLDPMDPPKGAISYSATLSEVVLASGSVRSRTWLANFITVDAALGVVLSGVLAKPKWFYVITSDPRMIMVAPVHANEWWYGSFGGPSRFTINATVVLLYWACMELKHADQSIEKIFLHTNTTDLEDKQASAASIAISILAKAVLLPMDVFFRWIFTNERHQRLLSRAAKTIVIKTSPDDDLTKTQKLRYLKE
jgi:hypothetical protein